MRLELVDEWRDALGQGMMAVERLGVVGAHPDAVGGHHSDELRVDCAEAELARDLRRLSLRRHEQDALDRRDAARRGAGETAVDDQQREQRAPERQDLGVPEAGVDDDLPGEEGDERRQCGEVEERGQLVERRLSQPVLVAVVELGELRRDDERRQHQQGRGLKGRVADDDGRDPHRGEQRNDVGDGQEAAMDRVAAANRPPRPVALGVGAARKGALERGARARGGRGAAQRRRRDRLRLGLDRSRSRPGVLSPLKSPPVTRVVVPLREIP